MTDDNQQANPLAQYLPGTEGSKFQTVDDLAKAKLESDKFIENLKSELREVREELAKSETMLTKARGIDEVLNAVKGLSNSRGGDEGSRDNDYSGDRNQSNSTSNSTGVDSETLAKLVQEQLGQLNETQKRNQNWTEVQNQFAKRHNNDPEETLVAMKATARELGMEFSEFQSLASQKPQVLLRASGLADLQGSNSSNPMRFAGAGSGGNPAGQGSGVLKNKAYFDNIKSQYQAKGQVHKYYGDVRIQNEYHKAVEQLGDKFFE